MPASTAPASSAAVPATAVAVISGAATPVCGCPPALAPLIPCVTPSSPSPLLLPASGSSQTASKGSGCRMFSDLRGTARPAQPKLGSFMRACCMKGARELCQLQSASSGAWSGVVSHPIQPTTAQVTSQRDLHSPVSTPIPFPPFTPLARVHLAQLPVGGDGVGGQDGGAVRHRLGAVQRHQPPAFQPKVQEALRAAVHQVCQVPQVVQLRSRGVIGSRE
jgi:hypothetical protein